MQNRYITRHFEEGYVTVFVSLILGAMMLFFVFALELSYLYAGRARAARAVTDCTRGFFGDFDPAIFDRYHLLMIDDTYGTGSDGYLEERLSKRLEDNLNSGKSVPFSYEVNDLILSERIGLLDNDLKALKEQIHDYCLYATVRNVMDELKEADENGEDGGINYLPGDDENVEEGAEYRDPRSAAGELKGDVLLRYVCPAGDLPSTAKIDLSSVCSRTNGISPESSLLSFDFSSEAGVSGLVSSVKLSLSGITPPTDSIEFTSYVRALLSDQVNKRDDSVMKPELEYLLFGRDTDSENVENAVNDIILIRFPFNYSTLKKSPTKQALITAAATGIALISGVPIGVLKVLLNAAASYMESVMDVKALLAGERVSLIKTEAEWRLSLKAFLGKVFKQRYTGSSGKGLTYRDYLTILLLLKPNKKACYYRLLDIIALNCGEEGDMPDMDHMICGAGFACRIELIPRFSEGLIRLHPEAYEMEYERDANY